MKTKRSKKSNDGKPAPVKQPKTSDPLGFVVVRGEARLDAIQSWLNICPGTARYVPLEGVPSIEVVARQLSAALGISAISLRHPRSKLDEAKLMHVLQGRCLSALQRLQCVVRPEGISFRQRGEMFKYQSADLALLVGKPVSCWFDPQKPDAVIITDMAETTLIQIPRLPRLPGLKKGSSK